MKREGLLERARENVTGYQQRLTKLKETITNEFQSLVNLRGDFVDAIVKAIESASRKSDTRLELKCIGYECDDPSDKVYIACGKDVLYFLSFERLNKDFSDLQTDDMRALLKHAHIVYVRRLFEAVKREFAEFDIQSNDWTDVKDANLTISWEK